MNNPTRSRMTLLVAVTTVGLSLAFAQSGQREWLAGDSHIHSHWSPGYDRTKTPPEPIKGADALYSTPTNASKAKEFGLSWMVTTDHGGPNHSKMNLVEAYAELYQSRKTVPEILQFYGMEFNMPAMDHHTLIIPNTEDEWKVLFNIESQFDANESWPRDPSRNSEGAATKALLYMSSLRRLPLVFANHPSRSATDVREYGLDEPREFRSNNDVAPDVYRGMEGAPGHQAGADRGAYDGDRARTFGGFDQMTAIVGGLWDSMLGEGRRFWIVATSDSHAHYADPVKPGSDFWPGEYQKTYVKARRNYEDILDGLRAGRSFAVAGDLIRELDVTAEAAGTGADIGGTLTAVKGDDVRVTIRFRIPRTSNPHGDNPRLDHLDLIAGEIRGPAANRNLDKNETTKVAARFAAKDWRCTGHTCTMATTLPNLDRSIYLRVRGTNTPESEPQMDSKGENPWADLWFYSNPIFIEVKSTDELAVR